MAENKDTIDFVELYRHVWQHRFYVLIAVLSFAILGLIIAFVSPHEYDSEAILLPETQQQQGQGNRLLQQFGGAFGLRANLESYGGMIPPQIYPRIVNSVSFQLELLERDLVFANYNVQTNVFDFYTNHYRPSLFELFRDYTIGLPSLIKRVVGFQNRSEIILDDYISDDLVTLTMDQKLMIDQMRSRISVNLDQETGLLTSRVRLNDPLAAAELNRHVIMLLKDYVTEYRVEKTRQNLEFVEEQQKKSAERFELIQKRLADFRDQNINLVTARARTELETLEDEKNLAFNIYSTLSQRLEEVRLELQEQTPVFKVLQSAIVPVERSSPRRGIIIITFTLFGFFISLVWITIRHVFHNIYFGE